MKSNTEIINYLNHLLVDYDKKYFDASFQKEIIDTLPKIKVWLNDCNELNLTDKYFNLKPEFNLSNKEILRTHLMDLIHKITPEVTNDKTD